MNIPPTEYSLATADDLRRFATTAFERAAVPLDKAGFLAEMLVQNDLRGVFSHGTRQLAHYVPDFREATVNPDPQVRVVNETPTSLVVDGDGGLGYFPCDEAARQITRKAREIGMAAAITWNHGHIGAAGLYARIPLAEDLFGFITSGCQLDLNPMHSVLAAAGGSPMAFAIPAGEEPALVLDFGTMTDLYGDSDHLNNILWLAPGVVARSFGLGCVCQALGGLLAGVPIESERADRAWPGANQGAFMMAVDLSFFGPIAGFKQEMDDYARKVRAMRPLPGFDMAALPGGPEEQHAARFASEGIPVARQHAESLRRVAEMVGLESPV